jgi:hypothetical protein
MKDLRDLKDFDDTRSLLLEFFDITSKEHAVYQT